MSTWPSSTTRSRSRSSDSSRRSASAARRRWTVRRRRPHRARRHAPRDHGRGTMSFSHPGSTHSNCSGSSAPPNSCGEHAPPTRSRGRKSPCARTADRAPSSATSCSWVGSAHEPPAAPDGWHPGTAPSLHGQPIGRLPRHQLLHQRCAECSYAARCLHGLRPLPGDVPGVEASAGTGPSTAGPWCGDRPILLPRAVRTGVVRLDEGFWMMSAVIGLRARGTARGLRLASNSTRPRKRSRCRTSARSENPRLVRFVVSTVAPFRMRAWL